jgi:DnaJ-class molecular chaperone
MRYQPESIENDNAELEQERGYCTACSGSGEGQYDGTFCRTCKGTGLEADKYQDEP